jgi:hypothetical protein
MILAYAGDFDAASLTPIQADEVVRVSAQIEASVVSMRVLAAARSAEGSAWKAEGHRSAAEKLAHDAGTSSAAAKRDLATGRRMSEQPTVAAAALAGELSPLQAEAVCDGVATDPQSAEDLISKARQGSLAELNEEVARVKAAAVDQEERRRAIHAKRSFRRWTDRDGAFQAHLFGQPGDGAGLWRMLDPVRRRLNLLRNVNGGEREPLDALDYDALMIIAAVADGRDGELGLTDLFDLGLFPQLNATTFVSRSDVTDTAPSDTTTSLFRPIHLPPIRLPPSRLPPSRLPPSRLPVGELVSPSRTPSTLHRPLVAAGSLLPSGLTGQGPRRQPRIRARERAGRRSWLGARPR